MLWQEYIPLYSYFFGVTPPPPPPEDSGIFAWLFGFSTPPPPPIEDNPYFPGIFAVKEAYDVAVEEILRINNPDDVQLAIRRLHLSLCLTPFVATLAFLCFVYSVKLAYRKGKPFVLAISRLVQRALEGNERNELELRMDFLESLITKTVKNQQNSCIENMKLKMGDLIDSHDRVLKSTQGRLGDIVSAVQDLLQKTESTRHDADETQIGNDEDKATGLASNDPEKQAPVEIPSPQFSEEDIKEVRVLISDDEKKLEKHCFDADIPTSASSNDSMYTMENYRRLLITIAIFLIVFWAIRLYELHKH